MPRAPCTRASHRGQMSPADSSLLVNVITRHESRAFLTHAGKVQVYRHHDDGEKAASATAAPARSVTHRATRGSLPPRRMVTSVPAAAAARAAALIHRPTSSTAANATMSARGRRTRGRSATPATARWNACPASSAAPMMGHASPVARPPTARRQPARARRRRSAPTATAASRPPRWARSARSRPNRAKRRCGATVRV